MTAIRRILLALTGTDAVDAAIDHAVELATLHSARIVGVTDVDLARLNVVGMVPIGAAAAAHELIEHRRNAAEKRVNGAIARLEKACADASIACEVHREVGEPFETVARLWRYCDFTVVSLQGLFDYGVLQDPDDVLIRLVQRGVRPLLATSRVARPIRRVCVAYNGSMESAKAMKRFVAMNLWPNPEIVIVAYPEPHEDVQELLADAAEYMRDHGFDTVETVEGTGRARDHLRDLVSDRDCDLVVMGATARVRIFRNLIGDTALQMIRSSHVPLFLAQ